MSTEENKQVLLDFNKALAAFFNGGPIEPVVAYMNDEAKISVPGMPDTVAGLKQMLPVFQSALSNFQYEISDMVAEGDAVYFKLSWTATHTGDLMGIPATGKTITVSETHFERIKDGKIIEHGGNWDQFGMLQQLGAIPTQQ